MASTALLDSLILPDLTEQLSTPCPSRPLRVGVYCRISADDEKEGKGVKRQVADCLRVQRDRYADIDGEPTFYIDNDVTAMGTKVRKEFERLLIDLKAGRIDVLIVWHTDRLYRRIEELSRIMATWQLHKPEIAAVTVGKVDFTTPTGRLIARMMAIVGQYEVEHLIERCLRKKRELREEGKVQGGPRPFGYREGGYELDKAEADELREAAHRILVGEMSVTNVARDWNRRGVKTARGRDWTGAQVRRVLIRYRNVGIVEHAGMPVGAAQWAPVLDEATWAGLRKILGDGLPVRRQKPRAETLLAGIAQCGECGAVLWSAGQDPRGAQRYRCSASQHLKRLAKPIEDHVEGIVVGILSRPDAVNLLGKDSAQEKIRELHVQAAARKAAIEEAGAMFADGEIDRAELKAITTRARQRLAEVEDKLAELTAGSVLDGVVGPEAAKTWEGLDLDRRRSIIDHLVMVTVHRGITGGDRRSAGRGERFVSTIDVAPKTGN